MKKRFIATISGRVQGVGFRYFIYQRARDLNLAGHVRNLPDRTVEVAAQGPEKDLEALLAFLRSGPEGAVVEKVELTWLEPSDGIISFKIN
jgi:acylphosphatase